MLIPFRAQVGLKAEVPIEIEGREAHIGCAKMGFLLAQAELLLTDEAEAAMAEFWGHGPESQAHVERFRALLQRVRRKAKTN